MIPRQIREWRTSRDRAYRTLAESDRQIVDFAKRVSRLEAEVELAEQAAKRRGQK